jgi:hypothetical protein
MDTEMKKASAVETPAITSEPSKISSTDRKLTPIGPGYEIYPVAEWKKELGSRVRRHPTLNQLECIIRDGKYTEQDRPIRPLKSHGPQPEEPTATGDSISDANNKAAYRNALMEWEDQNELYLEKHKIFLKRNEKWHLQEDDNKAKLPQLYQLIVDQLSGLSQDLIATRKMDWEQLNQRQNPIEILQFVDDTHSAISSGVRILDQLDTLKALMNVKMKVTETVRAFYSVFIGKAKAANDMDCPKISAEMLCAIFLDSLPDKFTGLIRTFRQDALMGKHPYPTIILDTLPIIENFERDNRSTPAAPFIPNVFSVTQDDVEREAPPKKSLCLDFNSAEGCRRGEQCRFRHEKGSEKVISKLRSRINNSKLKAKCLACDGNHEIDKCPIMIKGNKALDEKRDVEESVNCFIDDIETVKRWKKQTF